MKKGRAYKIGFFKHNTFNYLICCVNLSESGKKIDLPLDQKTELQILIGKSTEKLISPYVYGAATIKNGKRYTDPSATEQEKAQTLDDLYSLARQDGLNQFKVNHPEYKDVRLTPSEEMEKRKREYWKKGVKQKFRIQ